MFRFYERNNILIVPLGPGSPLSPCTVDVRNAETENNSSINMNVVCVCECVCVCVYSHGQYLCAVPLNACECISLLNMFWIII